MLEWPRCMNSMHVFFSVCLRRYSGDCHGGNDWRKAPIVSAKSIWHAIKVIGRYDLHEFVTITTSLTAFLTELQPFSLLKVYRSLVLEGAGIPFKSGLLKGRVLSDGPALGGESRPLLTGLHQRLRIISAYSQ